MTMNAEHLAELHEAKRLLENPGLAARISNLVGSPIEGAIERLPAPWQKRVGGATESALQYAMTGALSTMPDGGKDTAYPRLHKFAAGVSGGVGGLFGLPGLLVDLPLLRQRSIASGAPRSSMPSAQSAVQALSSDWPFLTFSGISLG